MTQALRIAHIILSFGLCLLIERFKLSKKWVWLVWALIIANEIRGILVVYYTGEAAFDAVLR